MTKFFIILGIIIFFIASLSFTASAQEQITIATYYPSPYGSYRDLETQRLAVGYPASGAVFTDNFINVRTGYGDTISIGGDGGAAGNNDLEIRVSAPAARNLLTFWNVSLGTEVRFRASYCINYSSSPIITQCQVGYYAVACGSGSCNVPGMLYNPSACPLSGYLLCARHAD